MFVMRIARLIASAVGVVGGMLCVCGNQALCVADERGSLDASVLVSKFLDFISAYKLSAHLCGCSLAQVRTLCFWVAYVAPIVVCGEPFSKRIKSF